MSKSRIRPNTRQAVFHCFSCAYRHADGSVEGFVGLGFSDHLARMDCIEQVRRRLSAMYGQQQVVDENTLIFAERDLTQDEVEQVRRDWASNRRYAPDGARYSG
jgi:hypothetical protein